MSRGAATYATVMPDDDVGYQHPREIRKRDEEPIKVPAESADQKKAEPEREMLRSQITNNRKIVWGLILVAAILLIALSYVIFQNRKLTVEQVPIIQDARHIAGSDPPGPMDKQPETQWPNTNSAESRAAVRNDNILKQQTNRMPTGSSQGSALSRHRRGHSDQDDKARLETIVEEEEQDPVAARTREIIGRELSAGAERDARDEPLGTGSFTRPESDSEGDEPAEPRDEALIEPEEETASEKVVTLCSAILTTGTRVGLECGRECSAGRSLCRSHLASAAKKSRA